MTVRYFLPGMLLDTHGNLWIDLCDEGAVAYLSRRQCDIPLTPAQAEAIVGDLAHLGVRRARPFCLGDN